MAGSIRFNHKHLLETIGEFSADDTPGPVSISFYEESEETAQNPGHSLTALKDLRFPRPSKWMQFCFDPSVTSDSYNDILDAIFGSNIPADLWGGLRDVKLRFGSGHVMFLSKWLVKFREHEEHTQTHINLLVLWDNISEALAKEAVNHRTPFITGIRHAMSVLPQFRFQVQSPPFELRCQFGFEGPDGQKIQHWLISFNGFYEHFNAVLSEALLHPMGALRGNLEPSKDMRIIPQDPTKPKKSEEDRTRSAPDLALQISKALAKTLDVLNANKDQVKYLRKFQVAPTKPSVDGEVTPPKITHLNVDAIKIYQLLYDCPNLKILRLGFCINNDDGRGGSNMSIIDLIKRLTKPEDITIRLRVDPGRDHRRAAKELFRAASKDENSNLSKLTAVTIEFNYRVEGTKRIEFRYKQEAKERPAGPAELDSDIASEAESV